jgi:cytoskeletal protein RodZ
MSKMKLASLLGLVISLVLLLFVWRLFSPAEKSEPSSARPNLEKEMRSPVDPHRGPAPSNSAPPAFRASAQDSLGQALAVLGQHPDPDDPSYAAALQNVQKTVESLDPDEQIDAYQKVSEILTAER